MRAPFASAALAGLLFATAGTTRAAAEQAPGAAAQQAMVHLRYEAFWGGLHVADFTLSIPDLRKAHADEKTDGQLHLETRSLFDWVARLRLTAAMHATVTNAAPFLEPNRFSVVYANRKHDRTLQVDFTQPSARVRFFDTKTQKSIHPEETDKDGYAKAHVPASELKRVVDPLTGLIEALYRVRAHLNGNGPDHFALRGFDGRRRFDMEGQYMGPATRTINHVSRDAYRLRLIARPIAGFKARNRALWNGAGFDLFLSRDGRYLPLQIVSTGYGPVLTLIEECPQRCTLPKGN